MCDRNDIFAKELNPTFLYTWKGTRLSDDKSLHSHDCIEMIFIMSGNCRYRTENGIYEVSEGDLVLLNPGVQHQAFAVEAKTAEIKGTEGKSIREGAAVPGTEFHVGFCDVFLKGLGENELPLADGKPVLHTEGELRQRIFKICSSIEAENSLHRTGQYYMMKAYLVQLLLLTIRELHKPEQPPEDTALESANKKNVVEQVLNYFEDHYDEKISLDQIAGTMYVSPFYISKVFKSETGDAPIRHLINIRLEKAKELLENGSGDSIQEVAGKVGYDDAYHFSKLFKKKYGISPSTVKKG